MENRINIAELLRECPEGMELDCVLFDGVVFDEIDDDEECNCPILIRTREGETWNLTSTGCWDDSPSAKCVIFPKGKTTWEGFHRPFKDGDILINDRGSICIYKGSMFYNKNLIDFYCGYRITDHAFVLKHFGDKHFGDINEFRLVSKEEKQKFFQMIKNNGYKWNPETKTLEKIIEPKFKVGNIIQDVDSYRVKITEVNIEEECYKYESMIAKGIGGIPFSEQDDWELVPNKFNINTLKPFDKVLVRCSTLEKWRIQLFEKYDETYHSPFICLGSTKYNQCVPYESNKHLLNTTDDCNDFYKIWE